MAQAPKSRKQPSKPRGKQDGPLQVFTESAERVGGDVAFFGLVAISSTACLLAGIDPWPVVILTGILIAGWVLNSHIRQRREESKERLALDRLREKRGMELLKKFNKPPDQFTLLDNGDDL